MPEQHLLAVGGIYTFGNQKSCRLLYANTENILKDLSWQNTLAIQTIGEGDAKIICENETIILRIKIPVRLEIRPTGNSESSKIKANQHFQLQAHLYDKQGTELEVGKSTIFHWSSSGVVKIANDRSAGEFGFSSTAFGIQNFCATENGEGVITVRFGTLVEEFKITVQS